jgi:FlaA1/EpsC-like NDP-sugar epimerase
MTAREAAGLILLAATIGENRETYLLDMGAPVNINSLAQTMIELSGMIPNQDIAIKYTGLKPGEKLTESLSSDQEILGETLYPKIMRVKNSNTEDLNLEKVDEFIHSVLTMESVKIKQCIQKFVPDFNITDV